MSLMYLVTDFLSKHVARECGGQRDCLHGMELVAEAGVVAPSFHSTDPSIATAATAYVRLLIFVSSKARRCNRFSAWSSARLYW